MGKYLKLLAVLLIAAACGKGEDSPRKPVVPPGPEPPVAPEFFRARIAEQISGAATAVSFEQGASLAFFWGGGSATADISEVKDTLVLEPEIPAVNSYYAVYPASAAKDLYGNSIMVDIPAAQGGSFKEACILLAKTDPEAAFFELRNLCALGSITLGRDDIKKISISGNQGEALAGTVYASFDADGIPVCAEADADEITLEPDGEAFAPGTYYFAAAPGTLFEGVSFTLETAGGNVMIGTARADETVLGRAAVLDFGTIDNISDADALRLRFIFGPEAGTKESADVYDEWPDESTTASLSGISCRYPLDGTDYSFYAKALKPYKGVGRFYWSTGDATYGERLSIPIDSVYFGMPAIQGLKLVEVVAGQIRRGAASTNNPSNVGITTDIPAAAGEPNNYVAGGELITWPGGLDPKTIYDRTYSLSGTETGKMYYITGTTESPGVYLGRLVLTYEKADCAHKGFPEEWEQGGGVEPADIYADADIRILFIGNSFTRDAVFHLPGIIKAAGIDKKILLTHMYYGGRTAQRFYKHWNDDKDYTCYQSLPGSDSWTTNKTESKCTLAEMAARTDWDIVTIQEHTGNQTSWYWTDDEKTALQGLVNYAKSAKQGNTPEVHYVMSQAYLNLEKAGSNQCFSSEAEMYAVITTQARKVMTEISFDGIISTGTMLQNLRTSSLNDEMHLTRDGFHMNLGISRYGAACTVFESIITPLTGKNLDGNAYRFAGEDDGITIPVTDATAPVAIAAARAAIQKPYEVTNMNN